MLIALGHPPTLTKEQQILRANYPLVCVVGVAIDISEFQVIIPGPQELITRTN